MQERSGGKTLHELATLARSLLRDGQWTLEDVDRELGINDSGARYGNATLRGPYKLLDRALHVFEESLRVERFVTEGLQADEMGALMNGSHFSCAFSFDCSCAELNELTEVCRQAGALGSRLTGAGWGGWTVNLVRVECLHEWIEEVWAKYFAGKGKHKEDVILVSRPSGGACYINV